MGSRRRSFGLVVLTVLAVVLLAGTTHAAQPPLFPAWHDGTVVHFTVVNDNVVGVDRGALHDVVTNPFYTFGVFPNLPQMDVLSLIPGQPGYSPWWQVIFVAVLDGRDVTTNPFTSEAEILAAAAAGDVLLIDTDFIFLCQVLPGQNR